MVGRCAYIEGMGYGPACGTEATTLAAFQIHPDCPDQGDGSFPYCATHWPRISEAVQENRLLCGCVLLEAIDLTRADPGPGYAEMLRSL